MRPSVHPARVVFHEAPAVVAVLHAKAESEGLTLAEIMRRAARREVKEAACKKVGVIAA